MNKHGVSRRWFSWSWSWCQRNSFWSSSFKFLASLGLLKMVLFTPAKRCRYVNLVEEICYLHHLCCLYNHKPVNYSQFIPLYHQSKQQVNLQPNLSNQIINTMSIVNTMYQQLSIIWCLASYLISYYYMFKVIISYHYYYY